MDSWTLVFGLFFAVYGAFAFWRAPQNVEWQAKTFHLAPAGLRWYVVFIRLIAAMFVGIGLTAIWHAFR